MTTLLAEKLKESDAPTEQYERRGINKPLNGKQTLPRQRIGLF
jgi:hypothetical protein